MTQSKIWKIAMEQSAIDSGCSPSDFLLDQNKIVLSKKNRKARKYLELPFLCNFTSYGNNIVASIQMQYYEIVTEYINRFPVEHCFETPNLHVLMERLQPFGANVCFMAEYWLPDLSRLKALPCRYETKILNAGNFEGLYLPEWGNALCEKRKELDILGIGAYDNGKLIGIAGCSADCGTMWQIGIDVLPEYRKQGIASALTSTLAIEILHRDKVPFYCCAWSNIKSAKNASRSGFCPAWAELGVKSNDFIADMNQPAAK